MQKCLDTGEFKMLLHYAIHGPVCSLHNVPSVIIVIIPALPVFIRQTFSTSIFHFHFTFHQNSPLTSAGLVLSFLTASMLNDHQYFESQIAPVGKIPFYRPFPA